MTRHNSGNTWRPSTYYTPTRELVRDGADDRRDDFDDYDDNYDYDDGEIVYYEDSSRWRWAAAIAGAVVALAMILAILIVRGGDSVSTRPGIVPSKSAPALTPPRPTSRPSLPPTTSLPAETVTTVRPSASTSSSTAPAPAPLPTAPQVDPRAITYTVLGRSQPGDIVAVTYLDETGLPRTDFNVTLPWTKTIVSGGKVLVNSVTAVSLASHLNCTITDANGQILTSQSHNTIAAACTR